MDGLRLGKNLNVRFNILRQGGKSCIATNVVVYFKTSAIYNNEELIWD